MNSLQFKNNELKRFCALLKTSPQEITHIVDSKDNYYKTWDEIKINKTTGVPKTYLDGTIKKRTICPPKDRLHELQTLIKKVILSKIELPLNTHGGVKKKSNVTNSLPHKGKKYHFVTDLQDFFPNISNTQVYEALINIGFTPPFAYWITQLTTWKYKVPQGAPTSSHIANIVFLITDNKLIEFCSENNITYTRYVDDLTFSSPINFKQHLNQILHIIIQGGFNISYRKTEYHGKSILVTGIEIHNNYIDAPEKIRIKAEAELLSKQPIKPYTTYLNSIRKNNPTNLDNK